MPRTHRPRPASAPPMLAALGRHPLLTPESERELALRARAGDAAARDELIVRNCRLVLSLAKLFRDRGLPYADLVGHGLLGLIRAADKFDPGRGVKFSTHAAWWIKQAIRRAIAETAGLVHVPIWAAEAVRTGRVPPASRRLAEGRRAARVAAARAVLCAEWSVADPDRIADRRCESPGREVRDAEDALAGLLAALDARSRAVVLRRFGVGVEPATLREIAADVGLSAEGVRQVEREALATMRAARGGVGRVG